MPTSSRIPRRTRAGFIDWSSERSAGQCPNLLQVRAPLPRRTAAPQHRRHQTRDAAIRRSRRARHIDVARIAHADLKQRGVLVEFEIRFHLRHFRGLALTVDFLN